MLGSTSLGIELYDGNLMAGHGEGYYYVDQGVGLLTKDVGENKYRGDCKIGPPLKYEQIGFPTYVLYSLSPHSSELPNWEVTGALMSLRSQLRESRSNLRKFLIRLFELCVYSSVRHASYQSTGYIN